VVRAQRLIMSGQSDRSAVHRIHWMDLVARDPVPWLLDPSNPSVRFQTLRHIFGQPAQAVEGEQARILAWKPVDLLRRHWDPYHFWGRVDDPYFGGPVGNVGMLYLLTQLAVPRVPEIERTCEVLLVSGRHEDGIFSPPGEAAAPWVSYTGMVLQVLLHFGYGDHPAVQTAWLAAARRIEADPVRLGCLLSDRMCRAGAVKMLGALIHRTADDLATTQHMRERTDVMIDTLCNYLFAHVYDWEREDAEWMLPRFPRYYDTDIVEFSHVIAHTVIGRSPSGPRATMVQRVMQQMLTLQDESGRWPKMKTTPAFAEERVTQPSRWLTFEAVHALILAHGDAMYAPG
jgi:hypothetical protein